jgi:hypothetical protein
MLLLVHWKLLSPHPFWFLLSFVFFSPPQKTLFLAPEFATSPDNNNNKQEHNISTIPIRENKKNTENAKNA